MCLILAKIHMVTKHIINLCAFVNSLILAKIHMVTKHAFFLASAFSCLILAKIHMVTKQRLSKYSSPSCLILAKIHMVTKPQIHVTIYLKIIKYRIFYKVIDISSLAFILFIIISFASCSVHTPLFK